MPSEMSHKNFLSALANLVSSVPPTDDAGMFHAATLTSYRRKLTESIDRLLRYHRDLDPVRLPDQVFHPGRPEIVARMIVMELDEITPEPLATVTPFYGSGVYCLYYRGDHPAYQLISGTNIPIYAGMAAPANNRATRPQEQGKTLFGRLKDHRDSIAEAAAHPSATLALSDFHCRYLVVESGWEGAAENLLIRRLLPIWNKESRVCQGLGKHGDSHETRANTRSAWDTLHPGRQWATHEGNVPNAKTAKQIIADIRAHCLAVYRHDDLNQQYLEAELADAK